MSTAAGSSRSGPDEGWAALTSEEDHYDPLWFLEVGCEVDYRQDIPPSPLKVLWLYCTHRGQRNRWSLLAFDLLFFLGAALAAASVRPLPDQAFGILVVFATAWIGYWTFIFLDDVVDAPADAIAHPERPIPQGALRPSDYLIACGGMIAVAIALNWASGFSNLVALGALGLLGCLLMYLQGRIQVPAFGELAMPVIFASLPLYAFWVLDREHLAHGLLLTAFHYLADLSQDIPGGISDEEGDRLQGVQTFQGLLGSERASRFSVWFFLASAMPLCIFLDLRGFGGLTFFGLAAIMAWAGSAYLPLLGGPTVVRCAYARGGGLYYIKAVYVLLALSVLVL